MGSFIKTVCAHCMNTPVTNNKTAGQINRRSKVQSYTVFFPAASLYAAIVVPLSVYAMTGGRLTALAGTGHAREMLFGFALALVAGYLLGPTNRPRLLLLCAIWLAARLSYLFAPGSLAAGILTPLFALLLAVIVVPRFSSAKKWRNRMIQPLLIALCAVPVVYTVAAHGRHVSLGYSLLLAMIILLSLLMSFMGGRVIAPAAAGAYYRLGMNLEARVQPRLEAALILLHMLAVLAVFVPMGTYITGPAVIAAGLIAAIRLYRWRLWGLLHRTDLVGLGIGYGWLALGQLLLGGLLFFGTSPVPAIHLITVGAIGTLSICVMTRIHFQRLKRDPSASRFLAPALIMMTLATLTRFAAALGYGEQVLLLWVSALGWSIAYLLTTAQLCFGNSNRISEPAA